jgi:DNA-binding NtrC family response regulator
MRRSAVEDIDARGVRTHSTVCERLARLFSTGHIPERYPWRVNHTREETDSHVVVSEQVRHSGRVGFRSRPCGVQPKLLRVLESRTVRRLGENRHRPIDVRFISATHRDLAVMAREGRFRQDLYFRLAALPVRVPPLREREGDIAALSRYFLDAANRTMPPGLLQKLEERPWPGNVRQLKNFLECTTVLGVNEALAVHAPPPACVEREWPQLLSPALLDLPFKEMVARVVEQAERSYVEELLIRHDRNVSRAADVARIHRSYLHRLLAKHKLY